MGGQPVIAGFDLCGAGGVDCEPELIHIHIKAVGNAFVFGPGVEGFGLGDICGDAGIAPEDDVEELNTAVHELLRGILADFIGIHFISPGDVDAAVCIVA